MNRRNRFSLLAAVVFAAASSMAHADYTAKINPSDLRITSFDGWGCSLCWWANQFGNSTNASTLSNIFFTTGNVAWQGTTLPGLGMNIVRYNVGGGGGGAQIDAGTVEKVSPNMPAFKNLRGFQLNWYDSNPTSASWDWSVDANQRDILQKAKSRGVNQFDFFSNSPMWWSCYNHSTAGSDTSGDNLQNWNYGSFAAYLATVTKYARDNWGIPVTYVEPFNEPFAYWWQYPQGQEGCHFDTGTQQAVINNLRTELDNRGLQSVGVTASDENDVDVALNTWNALDATTHSKIAKVNVHGYQGGTNPYRGNGRTPLRVAVNGKKLWMSEYGEGDGSGLTMADSMMRDMNELRPSAWVYWQPLDSGGWGLIQSNPGDNWIGPANRKYFVFAQFSQHVRQNYKIYGSSDANSLMAYSPTEHKLVIVSVNFGTAQWINYDLTSLYAAAGPIKRWTTTTAPGGSIPDQKHQLANDITLTNKTFRAYFYANTVMTFEIANVYTDPISVSGKITLDGSLNMAQPLTFEFRPTDGGASFTQSATLDASGSFSLANIPPKAYNLAIKGTNWLRKVVSLDTTGGSITGLVATLSAGDANGDNTVDLGDFGLLVNAYGSARNDGSGLYDARADFNNDSLVDVGDFGLFINNYGETGDL